MKIPIALDKSVLTKLPKESYISKLLPRMQEERTRTFTTFVLTLLAIGIFGFFAISPTLSTIAELNKELDDSHFLDQKLSEKIANLATLQGKYAKLQDDLPVVMGAIPATPVMGVLVGQLQSLAQESGVSLLRVQTFPVDITTVKLGPAASTSYGFSLDVVGTSQQLNNFLQKLISFDRLVSIDSISLIQQSPNDPSLRMTLKGKTYFKQL